MTYEEALNYINQLNSRGIALGLERITALLERLGNPQNHLRCIHVAGTNGKGSVCAFLDSTLQKAGLRTGRYVSPTLYDYRERIQINGNWIEEQALAELLTTVKNACDRMTEEHQEHPTVFEVETAAAFLYFQQQNCDYVLLEVGMGGRLDSTNVIEKPVLSIITSISLDHTAMLGNSLEEIAAEKGGIIKTGCPAVLAPQQPEVMKVLMQRCMECGITPAEADETQLRQINWSTEGQLFDYRQWQHVTISLLGDYQCTNAMIALEALQILQKNEAVLTDEVIRAGLAEARWPGRFEVIHQKPLVIVDGAHNPAGAQALADTLQKHFAGRKITLLMGVFKDKDYTEIARIMSACSDSICCFAPQMERGLDADNLAEAVRPFYRQVMIAETAEKAAEQVFAMYSRNEDKEERIFVSFGSLSTICDIEQAVKKMRSHKEGQHGLE